MCADCSYDEVFDEHSTQQDVFDKVGKPLYEHALAGYNTTIFAYGQTGTGKTHTMVGNPDDPDLMGMIPRAFQQVTPRLD